jgi:hypothetical protein
MGSKQEGEDDWDDGPDFSLRPSEELLDGHKPSLRPVPVVRSAGERRVKTS